MQITLLLNEHHKIITKRNKIINRINLLIEKKSLDTHNEWIEKLLISIVKNDKLLERFAYLNLIIIIKNNHDLLKELFIFMNYDMIIILYDD